MSGLVQYQCIALTQLFLLKENEYNGIFNTQLPSVLFIPREFSYRFKSLAVRVLNQFYPDSVVCLRDLVKFPQYR